MVDSLTRLAMAQREVGLAIGEPPASRGYPPSVFGLFPVILEQAGNFGNGAITGFYTVLTEGDDWNDPVSDTARGILDGHLLLSRKLASENHYPAIDPLESLSRLQPDLVDERHRNLLTRARQALSLHRQYRELIDIGAYARGTNPDLDAALTLYPRLTSFLRQPVAQRVAPNEALAALEAALAI
jgi:flagellar biosynthesis/type III secretory pathway ATPase